MTAKKRFDPTLYLVTDRRFLRHLSLAELVARAVAAGVTMVQLREKECPAREFYELALLLKQILPAGIALMINDRLDIALAAKADGVHLGQEDLPVEKARALIGPEAIIGLTINNLEQLKEAEKLPVDYLAISPIFPTPTKTDTGPPWGPQGLARARKLAEKPLVAIGGLNEANVSQVIKAGADGIAVVSAICGAEDPEKASRTLRRLIEEARELRKNDS